MFRIKTVNANYKHKTSSNRITKKNKVIVFYEHRKKTLLFDFSLKNWRESDSVHFPVPYERVFASNTSDRKTNDYYLFSLRLIKQNALNIQYEKRQVSTVLMKTKQNL